VRSASLISNVTCHVRQHHMPSMSAVCAAQRLQDLTLDFHPSRCSYRHQQQQQHHHSSPRSNDDTKGKQGLRRAKRLTLHIL
jgi:hypothetical protein